NLDLLAERSNLPIAEARLVTARLKPNPTLSASADHLDLLGTGFDAENAAGPPEYALRVDFLDQRGKRAKRIAVADRARVVARRPDLLARRADLARARADVQLQVISRKPDMSMGAEARRQDGLAGRGSALGFFVSVPLAVHDRNQGEIQRSRREVEQLEVRVR